jgi:arylsulfatase A-like enzyme
MNPPSRTSDGVNPLASLLVAGWVLGAIEAAVTPARAGGPLAILFAAMLATLPALLVGLALWGLAAAYRRLPQRAAIDAWFESVNSADSEDRQPVIRAHAYLVGAAVGVAVTIAMSRLLVPRLFDIQMTSLASAFVVVLLPAQVCFALAFAALTVIIARAPLAKLDASHPLPIPRPVWARFAIVVTIPLFVIVYPFVRTHAASLSIAGDAAVLGLLACAGCQIWLVARAIAALRSRRTTRITLTLAVVMVGGAAFGYLPAYATASAAERALLGSLGGRIARAISDVDRDGASSLFGGRDCAAFDASRGPGQLDILNNGIDEDCNGSDAKSAVAWAPTQGGDDVAKGLAGKYNVLWIVIEALRPDHVPAYGYDRPTMPYLSELAGESLQYMNAYSQSSATVFSVQSMLTGVIPGSIQWTLPPKVRGVFGSGQPLAAESHPFLSEVVKREGYRTGIVLENYVYRSMPSLKRGFDKVYVAEPDKKNKNNRPRRNPFAIAHVADFLARLKPHQRFFQMVYLVDSHGPYTRHKDIDTTHFPNDWEGKYDTELAWTDQSLRSIVEIVRSRKMMWDKTIVLVTADHGEEMYEHGNHSHSRSCHVEVTHVPLLLRVPGVAPKKVDQRVALVDIMPTLLDLIGSKHSREGLSGQSLLVPALAPDKAPPNRPVFCSIATINSKLGTFFRRSVRRGNLALFQYLTEGRVALFDTRADRAEKNDLSEDPEFRTQVESMSALLQSTQTGNLNDHKQMAKAAKANANTDKP